MGQEAGAVKVQSKHLAMRQWGYVLLDEPLHALRALVLAKAPAVHLPHRTQHDPSASLPTSAHSMNIKKDLWTYHDSVEPVSDGAVEQHGGHGGVHATTHGTDHLARGAHLLAHLCARQHTTDRSVKAAQNKIPPEPMATTIKPMYASLFFMVFM